MSFGTRLPALDPQANVSNNTVLRITLPKGVHSGRELVFVNAKLSDLSGNGLVEAAVLHGIAVQYTPEFEILPSRNLVLKVIAWSDQSAVVSQTYAGKVTVETGPIHVGQPLAFEWGYGLNFDIERGPAAPTDGKCFNLLPVADGSILFPCQTGPPAGRATKGVKPITTFSPAPAHVSKSKRKTEPEEFPMKAYYARSTPNWFTQSGLHNRDMSSKVDDFNQLMLQRVEYDLIGEPPASISPHRLCPFCDEPLPESPSENLLQLLANLRSTAKPQPRIDNELGLTAPLLDYINLCQMHRAERTIILKGKESGWPSVIDWDLTRDRISSPHILRSLQKIINNPESSSFFTDFRYIVQRDGPLKTASINGQLNTFQMCYPGYFGERGLLVLSDALEKHFPCIAQEIALPLSQHQFLSFVLVPEAAVLLIEQDMDCGHREAIEILHASRAYGMAVFGEDSNVTPVGSINV